MGYILALVAILSRMPKGIKLCETHTWISVLKFHQGAGESDRRDSHIPGRINTKSKYSQTTFGQFTIKIPSSYQHHQYHQ